MRVAILSYLHLGAVQRWHLTVLSLAAPRFKYPSHIDPRVGSRQHGSPHLIMREREGHKSDRALGFFYQPSQMLSYIILGRKQYLDRHAIYRHPLRVHRRRGCRTEPPRPQFGKLQLIDCRYLGQVDHHHVVVVSGDTVDGDVGRARPHDLPIKDPELVVHQSTAVVIPNLDPGILEHGKLTMLILLIRLDAVLVIGNPLYIHTPLVSGYESLGHRSDVKFKRGDMDRSLSVVNVSDQLLGDGA